MIASVASDLLLGVDAGTTVIKSTLFDLAGREIAVAAQPSSLLSPQPGWAESDMEAVWRATVQTVRQVLQQAAIAPEAVLAIGLTGQGDGTWPVGAQGRPVRPAILHTARQEGIEALRLVGVGDVAVLPEEHAAVVGGAGAERADGAGVWRERAAAEDRKSVV